jgi:hypothetical protein
MVTHCPNQEKNLENCNCTYSPCSKKGICCECLRYHWKNKELPGCRFPDDAEKTWDRSLSFFIKVWSERGYG